MSRRRPASAVSRGYRTAEGRASTSEFEWFPWASTYTALLEISTVEETCRQQRQQDLRVRAGVGDAVDEQIGAVAERGSRARRRRGDRPRRIVSGLLVVAARGRGR